MASDIVERLRAKAAIFHAKYRRGEPDECWEWQAAVSKSGYGRFQIDHRRGTTASRVAMILKVGEIPQDIEVCHTCDNKLCVNPAHLFLGTPKDNSQDRVRKGRHITPRGASNGSAKLTDEAVRAIRTSAKSHAQLGREFSVSESLIRQVRNRSIWAHV